MKKILVVSILVCVIPCCGFAAGVDPATMVAWWDGGGITAGEYVEWWQRIAQADRPPVSTPEERAAFLEGIISAKLMIQEAESLGYDQHPNLVDWVVMRRTNLMTGELYAQALAGRLQVDENEVERMYKQRLTQVVARHIIVPTRKYAETLLDSIRAGIPFEDLALRHSTCSSGARGGALGAVRWGEFSDRWSEQAFRLEPGEVSPPFEVEDGYGIIKVESKTLLEPDDPRVEKGAIRNHLRKQKEFDERRAFLDSLKIAYDVDLDVDAVVTLCARYALKLADLGETRVVIDVDVIPDLTDAEKGMPVITFRGGSFTQGDVIDMILSQPYAVRPRLDDPDAMIEFVSRNINDTLAVKEAEARGLDRLPQIADVLEKIRQRRTTQVMYNQYITRDAVVPEDTLRAYYEAHKDDYMLEAGHTASKILVETKASADSILALLEEGEPFEEIARQRSIDPFSAPKGGDLGFLPIGQDPEFDQFFAEMEVGEIRYFRSLEGQVILWLRDKRERTVPTLEQARHTIAGKLLPRFKDRMLVDWLRDTRERLGVTTDEVVLEQIDLGA